jgi:hypothetical protein
LTALGYSNSLDTAIEPHSEEPAGENALTTTEKLQRYLELMRELRLRLWFIEQTAGPMLAPIEQPLEGPDGFLMESLLLQLRKVLELIAFSALAANHDLTTLQQEELARMWKAKNILAAVGRMNPEFYPAPMMREHLVSGENRLHPSFGIPLFERKDFVQVYDACGEMLHALNPFAPEQAVTFPWPLGETIERIRNSLRIHVVSLSPDNKLLAILPDDLNEEVQVAHLTAER